jgi:hypothetical protein
VVSSHVSAAQTESIVKKAEEQHAAMTELSGSEGRSLIDGARTSGYSVQSGLSPDFQTAKVYRHNSGARVVVVQLRGTNAPAMSRVTYLYSQGKLGVVEMASN